MAQDNPLPKGTTQVSTDLTQGTVGWFSLASGTAGVAHGQTARLSVVNLSATKGVICYGVWQNPEPIALVEDSLALEPGHGKECDVKHQRFPNSILTSRGELNFEPL
jgi:hypothetical protein